MQARGGPCQIGVLNASFWWPQEEGEFHRIRVEAGRPIRDDKGLVWVPWRGQGAFQKNV